MLTSTNNVKVGFEVQLYARSRLTDNTTMVHLQDMFDTLPYLCRLAAFVR